MRSVSPQLLERPCRGAVRIATSLIRRRYPIWSTPSVRLEGSQIIADLRTSLGLRLFRYPFYLDEALTMVRDVLRPGDIFIDGGANIGLFTLVAAERVGPTGAVISVEPGPIRQVLQRNVEMNGYSWVTVVAMALGAGRGRRHFTAFEGDGAGLSSFAPLDTGGKVMEVDVCSLDELVPPDVRERVRLVKLDVEGAEVEALRGATELLKGTNTDFLVELETGHLGRQGATGKDLRQLFTGFHERPLRDSPNVLFSRRTH